MSISRNPESSKMRILQEAERQFALKGLYGSSVNVIANKAKINKRMIYHYFGSKEELYIEVLKINLDKIKAIGEKAFENREDLIFCVKQIIKDYYYFLNNNPHYVKIMAWEEISGGKIAQRLIPDLLLLSLGRLREIYDEGVQKGIFRPNIDLSQLIFSVNGLCFITFSRKEMLQGVWEEDFSHKLEDRLEHIYNLVLRGICL